MSWEGGQEKVLGKAMGTLAHFKILCLRWSCNQEREEIFPYYLFSQEPECRSVKVISKNYISWLLWVAWWLTHCLNHHVEGCLYGKVSSSFQIMHFLMNFLMQPVWELDIGSNSDMCHLSVLIFQADFSQPSVYF